MTRANVERRPSVGAALRGLASALPWLAAFATGPTVAAVVPSGQEKASLGRALALGQRHGAKGDPTGMKSLDDLAEEVCEGQDKFAEKAGSCQMGVHEHDGACLARCATSLKKAQKRVSICYEDCMAGRLFDSKCKKNARREFWDGVVNGTKANDYSWTDLQEYQDQKAAKEALDGLFEGFWDELCKNPAAKACLPKTMLLAAGHCLPLGTRGKGPAALLASGGTRRAGSGYSAAGYRRWLFRHWLPAALEARELP